MKSLKALKEEIRKGAVLKPETIIVRGKFKTIFLCGSHEITGKMFKHLKEYQRSLAPVGEG